MAGKVGRPRKIRPAGEPHPKFVRLHPALEPFVRSEALRWGTSMTAIVNRSVRERMEREASQQAS